MIIIIIIVIVIVITDVRGCLMLCFMAVISYEMIVLQALGERWLGGDLSIVKSSPDTVAPNVCLLIWHLCFQFASKRDVWLDVCYLFAMPESVPNPTSLLWDIPCHGIFHVSDISCHRIFHVMKYSMSWDIPCHGIYHVVGYPCCGIYHVMRYFVSRVSKWNRPFSKCICC